MQQMTRSIMLAAFLGVVLGVALGYSPYAQPPSATARPQLFMMQQTQTAQPNVVLGTAHPMVWPMQLVIALLLGVVVATPLFLLAKSKVA